LKDFPEFIQANISNVSKYEDASPAKGTSTGFGNFYVTRQKISEGDTIRVRNPL
jgi:hypothetical protein